MKSAKTNAHGHLNKGAAQFDMLECLMMIAEKTKTSEPILICIDNPTQESKVTSEEEIERWADQPFLFEKKKHEQKEILTIHERNCHFNV